MDPAAPRRRLPPAGRGPGDPGDDPPVRRTASGSCCSASTSSTSTVWPIAGSGSATSATWRRRRPCARSCATPRSCGCPPRWSTGRPSRRRAGSTRPSAGPATPTCGCGCSPATACAACPSPPAPTPPTRARPRPGCGTGTPSGWAWRSSTAPSPAASSPKVPSAAGRPTSSTSSSSPAPTDSSASGSAPRRGTCCGCSTCRRSATSGASPRWLPVRVAFTAATAGARTRAEPRPRGDV